MTDEKPSAFMAYVTHKEPLDHQHVLLCTSLRTLLNDFRNDSMWEQNFARLNQFMELLRAHHEAENDILRLVQPINWSDHVRAHQGILNAAMKLLEKASAPQTLCETEIKQLLHSIEQHIVTLDKDFSESFDT